MRESEVETDIEREREEGGGRESERERQRDSFILALVSYYRNGLWVSCTQSACVVPSGSPTLASSRHWTRSTKLA